MREANLKIKIDLGAQNSPPLSEGVWAKVPPNLPKPLGPPVGEVEPGYENKVYDSKGRYILRYEVPSEKDQIEEKMQQVAWRMGDLAEEISQSSEPRFIIQDLLNTG